MEKEKTSRSAYEWLLNHYRTAAHLESIKSLLHWDQSTFLPEEGHPYRAEQLGTLAKLLHDLRTDPVAGEKLAEAESTGTGEDPYGVEAVNVREWRRSYDRATKIPVRLAVELARAASAGELAWEKAKPANDWNGFRPYLERIVALRREEAECLGIGHEPYDALLDEYEPGETAQAIEPVFARLREALSSLLDRIGNSPRKPQTGVLHRHFPRSAQMLFGTEVISRLGYRRQAGHIGVSAHPFSVGIAPGDTRITTRIDETFFPAAFFSTVHEAGHALYEQGLPAAHWGTPRGQSLSHGMHESQSRLWENIVGRSLSFWEHFYPAAAERFTALQNVPLETFHFAINAVRPSLVRAEADEVTYNLHVMMRFELEIALLRKEIEVADLPGLWNEKTKETLGLTVPDHTLGVLQDVHWSSGSFGYFPTYTLGNIYAAQFYNRAKEDVPGLESLFARGEFGPFLGWLREKIHAQGKRYSPRRLLRRATSEDLNPDHLIRYLNEKFGSLYGF